MAEKYRYFFEKLVQEGKEVIIDGTPIAPVHTHPSGHLPSQGDFAHVVSGEFRYKRPEIVVTSDWAYFLFPTKQTPDLYKDPSGKFQLHDFKAMEQQQYELEDVVVDHILSISGKRNQEDAQRLARNAVRLKTLTDDCVKYNVGFYALEKGKSVAQRIV